MLVALYLLGYIYNLVKGIPSLTDGSLREFDHRLAISLVILDPILWPLWYLFFVSEALKKAVYKYFA